MIWWTIVTVLLVVIVFEFLVSAYRYRLGDRLSKKTIPYSQAGDVGRFLVLGDSTAVGTGSLDPRDTTAGRLGRDFPKHTILNRGINGARVADLPAVLDDVAGQQFDLVLMQIGGNDIANWTKLDALEKDLKIVLKKAKLLSENVIVITAGDVGAAPFWPIGVGCLFSHRKRQVRRIFIRQCNAVSALFVDLYANKELAPLMSQWKYYAPDGFHPNGLGYGLWYTEIKKGLELLPKKLT